MALFRINFIGDIQLSSTIGTAIEDKRINPFHKVVHELKNADITIGNLEFPASKERIEEFTSSYSHLAVRPENLEALRDTGITHLSLANNHILDWGIEGIKVTQSILCDLEIKHFGAGFDEKEANREFLGNVCGINLALLSFCKSGYFSAKGKRAGAAELNIKNIVKKISGLRNYVDLVIVLLHWGTEFSFYPDPKQISQAHKIIDAGADAIVGHHPHVLQGWETHKGKPIFYSIGSFLYDPLSETVPSDKVLKERRTSIILRLSLNEKKTLDTEIIPTFIDEKLNLSILHGKNKAEVLRWLQEISAPILRGDSSMFYGNVLRNIGEREIVTVKKLWKENGIRFILERLPYLRIRHFRYIFGYMYIRLANKLEHLWKTIFTN